MATTSSGRAGSPPSTSRRTWKNSKLTCERPDNGESASRYNSSLNGTPLARIPAGMESSSEEDWEKEDPEETARKEARKQWLLKDTVKRSKSTQTELAWDYSKGQFGLTCTPAAWSAYFEPNIQMPAEGQDMETISNSSASTDSVGPFQLLPGERVVWSALGIPPHSDDEQELCRVTSYQDGTKTSKLYSRINGKLMVSVDGAEPAPAPHWTEKERADTPIPSLVDDSSAEEDNSRPGSPTSDSPPIQGTPEAIYSPEDSPPGATASPQRTESDSSIEVIEASMDGMEISSKKARIPDTTPIVDRIIQDAEDTYTTTKWANADVWKTSNW